jgi:hypothetical protein
MLHQAECYLRSTCSIRTPESIDLDGRCAVCPLGEDDNVLERPMVSDRDVDDPRDTLALIMLGFVWQGHVERKRSGVVRRMSDVVTPGTPVRTSRNEGRHCIVSNGWNGLQILEGRGG